MGNHDCDIETCMGSIITDQIAECLWDMELD